MKYIFILLMLSSCTDPNIEKQKAIVKEKKCKADFMQSLLEYDNTMKLAIAKGMKKDYEKTMVIIKDSLTTCDSAKKVWDEFSDKVSK